MLDIALLGTGGYMPMPGRFLTAMAARLNGRMLLVDCGEGTQVTLRMLGWGFKTIDVICITHFHADHIAGLPGLLLTIGNAGRSEPLTIVGPVRVEHIARSLCVIAPLPFELRFVELPADRGMVRVEAAGFNLTALPLEHYGDCFGYCVHVERAGLFDPQRAAALGLPKNLWNVLQGGQIVNHDGREFTPAMVMGPARKGIKAAYLTDSRPTAAIPDFVRGADLFICEGLYGEDDKLDKAVEHRHMLFSEAAALARDGEVKELWLTHFSPAMTEPERFLGAATRVFEEARVGRDRMTVGLGFEDV